MNSSFSASASDSVRFLCERDLGGPLSVEQVRQRVDGLTSGDGPDDFRSVLHPLAVRELIALAVRAEALGRADAEPMMILRVREPEKYGLAAHR